AARATGRRSGHRRRDPRRIRRREPRTVAARRTPVGCRELRHRTAEERPRRAGRRQRRHPNDDRLRFVEGVAGTTPGPVRDRGVRPAGGRQAVSGLDTLVLPDLPVRAVLDDVTTVLRARGTAVLVAPPGTGKTTLVPLALARETEGTVVVAEPRRLAARAAAARMAALLGEPVGETVGYSIRGDRRVSDRTRVEVVTSGLLVRRLQHDPELHRTSVVLLDECHERHLDADLLLALLLDARAGLRDDLRLLATSATVAPERLPALLGGAPVITAHAAVHPVAVVPRRPDRGERIEGCVARTVRTALSEREGNILVFLPGVAEI